MRKTRINLIIKYNKFIIVKTMQLKLFFVNSSYDTFHLENLLAIILKGFTHFNKYVLTKILKSHKHYEEAL